MFKVKWPTHVDFQEEKEDTKEIRWTLKEHIHTVPGHLAIFFFICLTNNLLGTTDPPLLSFGITNGEFRAANYKM